MYSYYCLFALCSGRLEHSIVIFGGETRSILAYLLLLSRLRDELNFALEHMFLVVETSLAIVYLLELRGDRFIIDAHRVEI